FTSINETLLYITLGVVSIMVIIILLDFSSLDVMSLGRDHAINLGINYDRKVSELLIIVAILVSASTALVVPIMFLGLLVINIEQGLHNTYEHSYFFIRTRYFEIIDF